MSSMQTEHMENNELPYEKKLIFLWSFTLWIVVMNTTMCNVALASVIDDLQLAKTAASWIVSGYSIVFAIATLTYSRLSDFIPINRLLLTGLILLGISSVIGILANSFIFLIIARVLQAAGAGAVPALAFVLAARYIPIKRRGRAMAYFSSAASLGFGLGPVIGGGITQYFGWNVLFVVTGVVILLLPSYKKLLPIEQVRSGNFDFYGSTLTTVSVVSLLLAITINSFIIFVIGILLFIILWKHIHAAKKPFIQPELLHYKQYLKVLFISFAAFTANFSTLFLMPIILSVLFAKEPVIIGMLIFPGAMLSAFAAPFIGRFIDQLGNKPVLYVGNSLLIISTLSFTIFLSLSPFATLVSYIFMSLGFSTLVASASNEITRILAPDKVGAGMGIIQLIQFIGGAMGVSLSGTILVWQQDLLPAIPFISIYGGITLLLLFSFLSVILYFKDKKQIKVKV